MRSTLFANTEITNRESEVFVQQNKQTLLVNLNGEIFAKKGAMTAYQGHMDFEYHGGGASRFVKKMVTGENLRLMKIKGQGDVFLADYGADVHIVYLENEQLTVNANNILAFESNIQWDITRVKAGMAGFAAGGLFNTTLSGAGSVAIVCWGTPVVIQVDQPTFVDAGCALAWSTSLNVETKSTFKAGSLIGRGSGEAFQMAFTGQGFVVVQAGEGLESLVRSLAVGS